MERGRKVLLGSVLVAVLLISIFSLLTQDVGIIINVGVIALFIVVTPLFLLKYVEFLWIKAVEKQFPSFIRDLAGLKKSGITLSEAIKMTTKNNYGKLTPEVKKFSNRLSWGVHFLRALEIFSNRFRSSMIITEILGILKESYLSGGNIAMTLDSLSKDMVTLREIEEERKSVVRQHVMIMYGIFFMFVVISIAIIHVLMPMMSQNQPTTGEASTLLMGFEDPCSRFYVIFPCGYFDVLCTSFTVPSGIGCYYFALFFTVLITQAIFMGLIAGQLGENSIVAGTKHSLIMLASVFIIFMFMIKSGLLPIV
ncbi:MAG: type II secretion system F family protein [Candidatus Aenigmarchaeota archaeon]|nr:type II secretion system F family protein [Candidatus Aenigmarchaeota archaeon]